MRNSVKSNAMVLNELNRKFDKSTTMKYNLIVNCTKKAWRAIVFPYFARVFFFVFGVLVQIDETA